MSRLSIAYGRFITRLEEIAPARSC